MIEINISSSEKILLKYLCLDFNGTLSFNKTLIKGVAERVNKLKNILDIYVVTADTFSNVEKLLETLPVSVKIISESNQGQEKFNFIKQLGLKNTVSIGNGYNDRLMLKNSALSIAVIGQEGVAHAALHAARISVFSILDGLDLLLYPDRIKATLRD